MRKDTLSRNLPSGRIHSPYQLKPGGTFTNFTTSCPILPAEPLLVLSLKQPLSLCYLSDFSPPFTVPSCPTPKRDRMSAVPQVSSFILTAFRRVLPRPWRRFSVRSLASFTLSSLVSTTASMPPCFSSFSYSPPLLRNTQIEQAACHASSNGPDKAPASGPAATIGQSGNCQGPNACQKARYAA